MVCFPAGAGSQSCLSSCRCCDSEVCLPAGVDDYVVCLPAGARYKFVCISTGANDEVIRLPAGVDV